LPKGAKEELNYPNTVIEKVLGGEPLWAHNNDELLEEEGDDEEKKKGLNEE